MRQNIFDCILVVSLEEHTENEQNETELRPTILYQYPSRTSTAVSKQMMSITQFCFPDLQKFKKRRLKQVEWRKIKLETFSFVLTESNSERRWGYCRRIVEEQQSMNILSRPRAYPKCYCILSFIPCFTIFSRILDIVTLLPEPTEFLKAIYEQPLPAPGDSLMVSVNLPSKKGKDRQEFCFQRPDDVDSLLDHVNFEPLFHYLSPVNIIKTFAALLVERRVIFVSDRLRTLSTASQAFIAALYPLSWQHVFIPVLPESLLSFCCAPMPFIVGVLRSSMGELKKLSGAIEEDVIVVDIDNNKFISKNADHELIPPEYVEDLVEILDDVSKSVREKYSLWDPANWGQKRKFKEFDLEKGQAKDIANAFIGFMVDILGEYRSYIGEDGSFDQEGFLQGEKNAKAKDLLAMVVESQMFAIFIEDRGKLNRGGKYRGKFEKRLTRKLNQSVINRSVSSSAAAGNGPKDPRSRFTMYEIGKISREDVTKSVQDKESDGNCISLKAKRKKTVVPDKPRSDRNQQLLDMLFHQESQANFNKRFSAVDRVVLVTTAVNAELEENQIFISKKSSLSNGCTYRAARGLLTASNVEFPEKNKSGSSIFGVASSQRRDSEFGFSKDDSYLVRGQSASVVKTRNPGRLRSKQMDLNINFTLQKTDNKQPNKQILNSGTNGAGIHSAPSSPLQQRRRTNTDVQEHTPLEALSRNFSAELMDKFGQGGPGRGKPVVPRESPKSGRPQGTLPKRSTGLKQQTLKFTHQKSSNPNSPTQPQHQTLRSFSQPLLPANPNLKPTSKPPQHQPPKPNQNQTIKPTAPQLSTSPQQHHTLGRPQGTLARPIPAQTKPQVQTKPQTPITIRPIQARPLPQLSTESKPVQPRPPQQQSTLKRSQGRDQTILTPQPPLKVPLPQNRTPPQPGKQSQPQQSPNRIMQQPARVPAQRKVRIQAPLTLRAKPMRGLPPLDRQRAQTHSPTTDTNPALRVPHRKPLGALAPAIAAGKYHSAYQPLSASQEALEKRHTLYGRPLPKPPPKKPS